MVRELSAGYNGRNVIHGINFEVAGGAVLGVFGRNAAGKSTLLRALCGQVPHFSGYVALDDVPVPLTSPHRLLRFGITYHPQGGRVFPDLSIRDNLKIRIINGAPGAPEEVLSELGPGLLKRLREPARHLSGGERQLVALASSLAAARTVLLIDEPSLGLSGATAERMLHRLRVLASERCLGVVLVEQRVRETLEICDKVLVLANGQTEFIGDRNQFRAKAFT